MENKQHQNNNGSRVWISKNNDGDEWYKKEGISYFSTIKNNSLNKYKITDQYGIVKYIE